MNVYHSEIFPYMEAVVTACHTHKNNNNTETKCQVIFGVFDSLMYDRIFVVEISINKGNDKYDFLDSIELQGWNNKNQIITFVQKASDAWKRVIYYQIPEILLITLFYLYASPLLFFN